MIGTERHESRRIDNQLRGRSGRQGDVGSSVFFVSFEDDLVRVFGGDRMHSLLRMIPMDDENPISFKTLTNFVARAQSTVENRYFAARKNLLAYDNVNNRQREIIYAERSKILKGEDVHEEILKMVPEIVASYLSDFITDPVDYCSWDYKLLNEKIEEKFLPAGTGFASQEEAGPLGYAGFMDAVADAAIEYLDQKREEKKSGTIYGPVGKVKNGMIRMMPTNFAELERNILLTTVDKHWVEQINAMEELRKGIQYRAVGHQDPVICYGKEGFELFDNMNYAIRRDVVFGVFAFVKRIQDGDVDQQQPNLLQVKSESSAKKPGRNDPCPCGSGKKYKNCCGRN